MIDNIFNNILGNKIDKNIPLTSEIVELKKSFFKAGFGLSPAQYNTKIYTIYNIHNTQHTQYKYKKSFIQPGLDLSPAPLLWSSSRYLTIRGG
jgi:hypothetical protein